MPIFDDDDASGFKTTGSGFQFSGTNVNTLQNASEYTLVVIAADVSSSVTSFAQEIEGCLKSSLEACQKSPRVDNLLTRFLTFNHKVVEQHGFRPLSDCHLDKYTGSIHPSGSTSLYDASVNAVDSAATYGKALQDQEYTTNAVVVILTDGMDVGSTLKAHHVKEAVARARKGESLESIMTILVGINVTDSEVSRYLTAFKDEAGFDQYVEAKDATPKTFARIAGFISKSVSSVSQSVGSGGPSAPITF